MEIVRRPRGRLCGSDSKHHKTHTLVFAICCYMEGLDYPGCQRFFLRGFRTQSQPPFPSAARENPLVPRVGLDGIVRIISRLSVKASFKMT